MSRATRRVLGALAIAAAWLAYGLSVGAQNVVYARYAGRTPVWRQAFGFPLADAAAWALLTPFVAWLAVRVPFDRRRWPVALAVHAAAAIAASVLATTVMQAGLSALGVTQGSPMPAGELWRAMNVGRVQQNLLTYAAVAGVTHFLASRRRLRQRERAAAELRTRLAQARLEALRMQLQPHFLFNTLHSISTLMHRDVEAADRMMVRLSELLRLTLERGSATEVPLAEELAALDHYLAIEQTRFPDRLRVRRAIAPETLDARVPAFLLQPLVENAVRHAVAPRPEGGTVEVRADRDGDRLEIRVRDDGPGWNGEPEARAGVGLTNTRARLEALYGAGHRLELARAPQGGAEVRVSVPFVPSGARDSEP